MRIQTLRAAAAAFLVTAAVSLAATGAARAENIMKVCGAEWQAAKASNATNGQDWQGFLATCRTRHASAAPAAAAPAAAPAPAPMAPAPVQTAQPKPVPATKPMARPTGAGQFTTEYEAKARCPNDTVVWVNIPSHKYHYPSTRYYGATKQGAYMCEADAVAAGDVASRSRIGKKAQQQ